MKRLILALVTVSAGLVVARAETLVIKGSDTLGAKLVPQLSEEFKAQHPDTTFNIAAEGSTTGIAAIIDGTAEIDYRESGLSWKLSAPVADALEGGRVPSFA